MVPFIIHVLKPRRKQVIDPFGAIVDRGEDQGGIFFCTGKGLPGSHARRFVLNISNASWS